MLASLGRGIFSIFTAMKRIFIFLFAGMLCLGANAGDRLQMLVGTYTEGSTSEGVYLFSFDQQTADFQLLDTAAVGNPSFVVFSSEEGYAYSVSEYDDGRQAAVAYRLGERTIDVLGIRNLGGGQDAGPCNILYVNHYLLTSNYSGGSVTFLPVSDDKSVGPKAGTFYPSRPARMHCAVVSPDGLSIFAVDLGGDRIFRFPSAFRGVPEGEVAYSGKKGLGLRHFIFGNGGRNAYLLNELGDVLTVFRYRDGVLKKIQQLKAYSGKGHGSADIHQTPDGRFLYTSHRLKGDGIAIFRVNPTTGKVKKTGFQPTGKHPRNFAVTPNGKYLLCACRDSDRIEIYAIHPDSGQLTDTGKRIEIGKPVCIALR